MDTYGIPELVVESDFTGAAVGVTDADAGSLYLWTELT